MTDLKIVTNADSGTADIVGGNDWDDMAVKVNTYVNDTRSPSSYIIYVSGSNKKAFNTATKTVTSNTDASTLIQGVLDTLPATSGSALYFNTGFYSLTAKLQPPSYCSLIGEMEGGISQLRPTGDFPAIELTGKVNVTLEKLYLTHNQAGYTSNLLNLKNGAIDCNFRGMYYYDFGTQVGNAIGMDASTASVYRNSFTGGRAAGFENSIYATITNATYFITNVRFNNFNFYTPKRALALNTVASAGFDDNTFSDCEMQSYAGTLSGFDYETNHLGHSFYTVHSNCMVQDLPGATNYALLNTATEISLIGCYPAWKIGGAGAASGKIRTSDVYTIKNGASIQSGNGTTKVFNIAHGLAATPLRANVDPGSIDATGSPVITTTSTNVVVTYQIAPPSGSSNLTFLWQASVF